jgi:hypothetical protein
MCSDKLGRQASARITKATQNNSAATTIADINMAALQLTPQSNSQASSLPCVAPGPANGYCALRSRPGDRPIARADLGARLIGSKPATTRSMTFPKSLALSIMLLALLFAAGILIFVYFQGGVEHTIRSGITLVLSPRAYISV